MSRLTIEPLGARPAGSRQSADPSWEPRPRRGGLSAQVAWLMLIVKAICLQNANWILSASLHGVVMLSVAGIALSHSRKGTGVGIESALVEGGGGESFENVLGDQGFETGGGGRPLESVIQEVEASQQHGELANLNDELAKLGVAGSSDGDGGQGGGSGGGVGGGRGSGIGLGAGFFGSKGAGKTFVYVVDMSGSMYGHRFDRAKAELVRSINKLTAEQKFYVYFFNDKTFALFDPKPAKGLLAASPDNKQRASKWIRMRTPASTTNPNFALQQALEMKPDVIFLLTDGELDEPEAVRQMICNYNKSNVVIHTIAFENEEGAATLEAI